MNQWVRYRKTVALAIIGAALEIVGAITLPRLRAQGPLSDSPSFDVASIKPNTSGEGASDLGFWPGGRFRAVNETVYRLISEAYAKSFQLPRFQVVGGPNWIDSDRFDVEAVAETDRPIEQRRLMLRRLLAERFKLVTHYDVREQQIFDLVAMRED